MQQWEEAEMTRRLRSFAGAAAEMPMMGVFNNLVIYDQRVPQNSLQSMSPTSRPAGRGTRWNRTDVRAAPGRQVA
jgi:hypothetical protein